MSMVIPTKRCFKNPSSKTGSNYYQRESSNPNHNYQVKHGNTSGTRNVKCTITSLTLSLQLVKNPGILERSLARLRGLLLELFNGSLVNTSALVDQVTSGGGLAGVDVAADDQGQVGLSLSHCCYGKVCADAWTTRAIGTTGDQKSAVFC